MRGVEVGPKSYPLESYPLDKNAFWTPDARDLGVWVSIRHTRRPVWSPARAKQARRQGPWRLDLGGRRHAPWRLGVGLVFLHTAC